MDTEARQEQKNPLDDWATMLRLSPLAESPNARVLLTTVKAFFLSAEFHAPRDTIGVDPANLQDFKKSDNVLYPDTLRYSVLGCIRVPGCLVLGADRYTELNTTYIRKLKYRF